MSAAENGLSSLNAAAVNGMRRGIEKESLRTRPDGSLAITPHPAALGSPLTHAHITTDFSESQLELITGARASVDAMLEELTFIHQVVCRALTVRDRDGVAERNRDGVAQGSLDELLWCASMPCQLPPDDEIPLGRYGDPEEVAQMTLSLVLPAASYLNGAVIPVDGGMMAQNT